jgi:iron complex transport system substrate-binding protein
MRKNFFILPILATFTLTACAASENISQETLPPPGVEVQVASATPEASATPFVLELSDALGRNVQIIGEPRRVVSLSPFITSTFFSAGAEHLLVGRDSLSLYPAEAEDIPSFGDMFSEFDAVQFIPLDADLVLADETYPFESILNIEALGVPIFILPTAVELEDIYSNISIIGSLTNQQELFDLTIEDFQQRLASVGQVIGDTSPRPRVFYELEASDPENPWTYGAGTILDEILELAGSENAALNLEGTWVQFPLSELQAINPEFILLADAAYGIDLATLQARPGWTGLEAVLDGQVLAFDETIISKPGPRIIEMIEALAAEFHPNLFP